MGQPNEPIGEVESARAELLSEEDSQVAERAQGSSEDSPAATSSEGEASENQAGGETSSSARRRRRKRRTSTEPAQSGPEAGASDERSEKALEFLSTVLSLMGMDCNVALQPTKEGSEADIQLEIRGRDAGRIIGKKGQVLSALQFLLNRVINRPDLERRYLTVDAEGYRSRRDNSLATMAQRLGRQAVTDGKIITFEPMNPRDRRVVHLALAKFEGVITKSEGEGPERRVQIIPVRR
jgi:spoIIIJ-associated protein